MQAQLFRKTKKPRVHSPKERRLRIAELLHDEHRKVNKFYSGSSSPTLNNNVAKKRASPSDQLKSLTSSPYDISSNDNEEYKLKGLAYRKKNKNKKKCRISPSVHPHAICLNHITAQPYCSFDVNEMFNAFPKYYKGKNKYVMNWLRKNFGRTAKPKPPPLNQESTSESSDYDSTSDTDEDTTESETVEDIQTRPLKRRRRYISEDSDEESSSELCSDSETTSESS